MNCENPTCGAVLRRGNHGPLCDPCLNSGIGDERVRFFRRIMQDNWTRRAACQGWGAREAESWAPTWFPERNSENRDMSSIRRERMAYRHCALCPVRRECLATAYANSEHYGIWGGVHAEQIQRDLRALERMFYRHQSDAQERAGLLAAKITERLMEARLIALAHGFVGDDELEEESA